MFGRKHTKKPKRRRRVGTSMTINLSKPGARQAGGLNMRYDNWRAYWKARDAADRGNPLSWPSEHPMKKKRTSWLHKKIF